MMTPKGQMRMPISVATREALIPCESSRLDPAPVRVMASKVDVIPTIVANNPQTGPRARNEPIQIPATAN